MEWFTAPHEDAAVLFVAMVTLISAIIGATSKTTIDGQSFPKNVTIPGWIIASTAVLGFGGSVYLVMSEAVSNRALELAALTELEGAHYLALEPFLVLSEDPHIGGRYETVAHFSQYRDHFYCDIDLHDQVESNNGVIGISIMAENWGSYLAENAELVRNRLISIVGSYGGQLEPQMVFDVTRLASDPWFSLMVHTRRRVEYHHIRHTSLSDPIRFLCTDSDSIITEYDLRYKEFMDRLGNLERSIERRQSELVDLLGRPACPPFEKTIYGNLQGIC